MGFDTILGWEDFSGDIGVEVSGLVLWRLREEDDGLGVLAGLDLDRVWGVDIVEEEEKRLERGKEKEVEIK